jgi:uncharacterized membrane protein
VIINLSADSAALLNTCGYEEKAIDMYKATIAVLTQSSENTNATMAGFVSMFLGCNVIKKVGDSLQEALIDKKQQGAMRDGRNRRAISIPWLMMQIASIQHKLGGKEQAEETIREAIVLFRYVYIVENMRGQGNA